MQQERAIGGRYAQQVGEVEQGVVVGDLGDEVAGAVAGPRPGDRAGEEGAGPFPYDRFEVVHAPRGEGAADERTQAPVVRWVLVEHHPADERQVCGVRVADLGGTQARGVRGGVLQHADGVLVPGDRPEARARRPAQYLRLLLPRDGVMVAQMAVAVVGDALRVLPRIEDVRDRYRRDGPAHALPPPPPSVSARKKSSTARITSSGASSIA